MQLSFATQSYQHPSLPLSAQRLINLYAEAQPQGAKSQIALLGPPGIVLWNTVGSGPIRGATVMNNVLYVVSGGFLYSITTGGTITSLGGTVTGSGIVGVSNNGTQVIVVNGTEGYIWSATLGFVLITDPSFFASNLAIFFDNFFVLNRAGTNQMFVSNVLDGTIYNGLAFASATVQPTQIVSLINQQENLFVFTQKNIETWYDAGSFPFPFARYDGATIERGCTGNYSPVKEDNSVFFMGDDLIFYRLNGIIPIRISTHAIEAAWNSYSTTNDVYSFSYSFNGHKFIVVTFPTTLVTWVYDVSTNLWHERESWDMNNNTLGRWRASCYIKFNGLDLVGDCINGSIGQLTPTTYTEYGNTMRSLAVSPPIHSDRKRIFHTGFELDIERGVGTTTGQGVNPEAMLDWSDDGGHTFKALQPWHSMGRVGQYGEQYRLRWTRLGEARQRYYRVQITDPVRRTIIAANASMSLGM